MGFMTTKITGILNTGMMLILTVFVTSTAFSQNLPPARSYRGDEFISLNDGVPFNTAVEILNQFSKKFEGKLIVDPLRRTQAIGVVIDNMYWKKAFEYILTSNGLKYNAYDQYYEIAGDTEEIKAKAALADITSSTKEVRIEAVFFEADRTALSQIGVDWSTFQNGKVTVDATSASNITNVALEASLALKSGVWEIRSLMKTFESLSKGEVIAKPQIKVMDGQEGKVKVGKNFYLTTVDFAGNTRYSEYEAGTILTAVPHIITSKDTTFIHLTLSTERSQVIPDPTGVSKVITESRTQILLLNGEQTVIAGLYINESITTRKGIPFLKDLPPWLLGLRYLFGYNSLQTGKKELVIFIKAEIIPEISKRRIDSTRQKKYMDSVQENIFK